MCVREEIYIWHTQNAYLLSMFPAPFKIVVGIVAGMRWGWCGGVDMRWRSGMVRVVEVLTFGWRYPLSVTNCGALVPCCKKRFGVKKTVLGIAQM